MKRSNINFYNLFWIFIIGSIFGFLIELLWFVVKWGSFQYNQGLLYGPFVTIYGFGAVILTILCYLLKNQKKWLIFIVGFVAFGLFEHLAGLFLEHVLGAFAWDYSRVDYNFTIGKYVYLPYCFVWGAFTVIWFTWIQNPLLNFINKYMNKIMKCITIIFAIFMTLNIIMTSLATIRLVERASDIPPSNRLEEFIDRHYDDEFMRRWMPKRRVK